MRKLLETVTTLAVLSALYGCAPVSETSDKVSKADNTSEKEEQNASGEEVEYSSLPNTYKVPSKEIYVDCPNYQAIEQGFTRLYIVHGEKYCAVTSALKADADTLEEAHELAFAKLQQNLVNYEGGINYLDVTADETVVINGIEAYYFEGTINYGTDNIHDGYAVGYSFIVDDVPCQIIGSVISNEQSAVDIKEIKTNVDAMMRTVRTED